MAIETETFKLNPLDHRVPLERIQQSASDWIASKTAEVDTLFAFTSEGHNDVYKVYTLDGHSQLWRGEHMLCEYWFTMDHDTLWGDMRIDFHYYPAAGDAPMLSRASGLSGREPMLGTKQEPSE